MTVSTPKPLVKRQKIVRGWCIKNYSISDSLWGYMAHIPEDNGQGSPFFFRDLSELKDFTKKIKARLVL